jgi:hypothetical protein
MSVIEYGYQKATHNQMKRCLAWCLNQLQLRDWEIELYTGDTPPKAFMGEESVLHVCGMTIPSTNKLKAEVWVNIPVHKRSNQNEYATVIHETLHIFLTERGEDEEQVVRILEPLLYRLYCTEHDIKIKEKE